MRYILCAFLMFMTACSSYQILPGGRRIRSEDDYIQTLEKNTRHDRQYSGFYNTIDMQGTVLNSEMSLALLEQNTRLYQWDENKFVDEEKKANEKMAQETEFFLSFFTPERKNDNLAKSDTSWKVFLDVDGKRLEGKVVKIKRLVSDIQGLYPYYVRFATPYTITFPIPMKAIEGKELRLTITGSLGSSTLVF